VSDGESESVQKSDEDFGKPNNDLPNQEKNLFIDGKYELYVHKRPIKNAWLDLWERGYRKLAQMPEHLRMKTNNTSLFKMSNYGVANKNVVVH